MSGTCPLNPESGQVEEFRVDWRLNRLVDIVCQDQRGVGDVADVGGVHVHGAGLMMASLYFFFIG